MAAHVLSPRVRHWACPSCATTDRTEQTGDFTRMHPCAALGGITLPLVEVASPGIRPDARHVLVEREDYAYDPELSRFASVRTDHGDGSNDLTVLAPVARASFTGKEI